MAENNIQQQIFESINKSNRILIPLSSNPSGDSLASALALHHFLKQLNKEPIMVCPGAVPEKLRFLPGVEQIRTAVEQSRSFIISVRTENAPLDELSYHLEEQAGLVNIFLKPKEGRYEAADVSFRSDKFPYDLVVALGLSSLDLLGTIYDKNTDLFFETPIVNIDHHVNNEHFAEINLVDITATSTTEVLLGLLEKFESGLIDAKIATNLLAGILIETNSFQHAKTTPRAFLAASNLISLGANQQEIIKHLYKTKSVNLLKLWGRALARLKEVPELGLTYTMIRAEDLAKSGSQEIKGVMDELVGSLADSRLVILLSENPVVGSEPSSGVTGYIQIHPNLPAIEVANFLDANLTDGNFGQFNFPGKTLADAETEILARLQKLKPKIGI